MARIAETLHGDHHTQVTGCTLSPCDSQHHQPINAINTQCKAVFFYAYITTSPLASVTWLEALQTACSNLFVAKSREWFVVRKVWILDLEIDLRKPQCSGDARQHGGHAIGDKNKKKEKESEKI
ncbi:unnamed protein product [Sphenostylis stenocarpa]|uniref:Uncharacterized protein n=1 Tax=Sphenostylis stenocarpa TaxID=92480 RepID=A0AA86SRP1_9FABA|nr:unnamed protein product [Sphenostylis stenocarpa]